MVIESIGRLILYNLNIQCVNLDNTGLNSKVLAGFIPYLRHAKSLLCFHLAQNPGITKQLKTFWSKRLRVADKEKNLMIDIKRDRDDLSRPLTQIERFNMTKNEVKIRDYKLANYQRWLLEESAKIQEQR